MKKLILIITLLFASNIFAKSLYILSGGFVSCNFSNPIKDRHRGSVVKSTLHKNFKKYFNKEKNNSYIITCFGLDRRSTEKNYDKAKLRLTNSNTPNKNETVKVKDFIDYIHSFFNKNKVKGNLDSITLIGHSHGAHLLLKKLRNIDKSIEIKSFTTMDTISKTKCGVWDYFRSIIFFRIKDDCQRFPSDITEEDKRQIFVRVSRWQNIYEDNFRWLHSGPVSFPGINEIYIKDKNHMELYNSDYTWKLVKSFSL